LAWGAIQVGVSRQLRAVAASSGGENSTVAARRRGGNAK
jgi:hypothetical protein